jgi:hypothetical protein
MMKFSALASDASQRRLTFADISKGELMSKDLQPRGTVVITTATSNMRSIFGVRESRPQSSSR